MDGIIFTPPTIILQKTTGEDGKIVEILVRNPKFITWKRRNQTFIVYITTTLSKDILHTISNNLSTKELWNIFANNYLQISKARIMQLKHTFHNLCRGSKRIVDYLAEVKDICDSLAAIGSPISDKEWVHYILCRLGPAYNIFYTVIHMQSVLPNFQQLKAKLLQHETNHL